MQNNEYNTISHKNLMIFDEVMSIGSSARKPKILQGGSMENQKFFKI